LRSKIENLADQKWSADRTLGNTALGVREKLTGGTPNLKNDSKQVYLGRIIDLGVREGDTILIWGYAEGYNPDLGVREYQKVENPCFTDL
jgi:hypothetical protein